MIEASRRWFRRNRTSLFVGAGVIGAGYLAGQYVLGRIREARQRMSEDRVSKENLRRRFEQNQEDCTYTVLALLPTIREEIIGALPVEQITEQLQQERQERLKRLAASEAPSSEYPSAPPSIVDDASTASFVHTSQMALSAFSDPSKPKKSKAQLWQDMKINSIARALASLYTLSLLTLLTRIQLNLLGRRTYLSSVVSLAAPPSNIQSSTISLEDRDDTNFDNAYGNDFETNRMYLTFSWWILHRGAKSILERVIVAVKDVFGQVNIREDMTIERLSELLIEVRRRVEGATEQDRRQSNWLEYLLPPRNDELFVINQANQSDSSDSASPEPRSNPLEAQSVSPSLRRLLDETADLIDSPTFSLVLGHLLDASFSHLVDVRIAAEAFKVNVLPEGSRLMELPDTKCKLAHILPVFCRQAHAILAGSGELNALAPDAMSNEYLTVMDRVHDLEGFAAVIYSSNFEYEVVDSPRAEAAPLQQSVNSLPDLQLGNDLTNELRTDSSTKQLHDTTSHGTPQARLDTQDVNSAQDVNNIPDVGSAQDSNDLNTQDTSKEAVQVFGNDSLQEQSISQPTDSLTESAVAIEKTDIPSQTTDLDFESAWTKALGSENLTQASTEIVELPLDETTGNSDSTAAVPTMEAGSELDGVTAEDPAPAVSELLSSPSSIPDALRNAVSNVVDSNTNNNKLAET